MKIPAIAVFCAALLVAGFSPLGAQPPDADNSLGSEFDEEAPATAAKSPDKAPPAPRPLHVKSDIQTIAVAIKDPVAKAPVAPPAAVQEPERPSATPVPDGRGAKAAGIWDYVLSFLPSKQDMDRTFNDPRHERPSTSWGPGPQWRTERKSEE
jgi:hypothetical protein